MRVIQLINELQKMPPDMVVLISTYSELHLEEEVLVDIDKVTKKDHEMDCETYVIIYPE